MHVTSIKMDDEMVHSTHLYDDYRNIILYVKIARETVRVRIPFVLVKIKSKKKGSKHK